MGLLDFIKPKDEEKMLTCPKCNSKLFYKDEGDKCKWCRNCNYKIEYAKR